MIRHGSLAVLASALLFLGCDQPAETCTTCSDDASIGADATSPDAGTAPADDAGASCTAGCNAEIVVTPEWLAAHLGDGTLEIVDTRSAALHADARIPGALFLDPAALRATVDGVPGQAAPVADLQAAFRAAGLSRDRSIVVYGASTDTATARVFWTLELVQHPGVLFLDGGFARWTSEGRATESGASTATPSDYTITATDEALRVNADWVRDHRSEAAVHLVDARASSEFASGHIAGATNVDWMQNVSGGSLKARAELDALYAAFDPGSSTMIVYCQTGTRASVSYLVLRALGYADVRLYDGSWTEWSTLDPTTYPREP